jgi:hypothetical protein
LKKSSRNEASLSGVFADQARYLGLKAYSFTGQFDFRGSQPPALLKSAVQAGETLVAIRDVSLEQTSADYLFVRFHEALNLEFGQFTDDARPKSILMVSEGNRRALPRLAPAPLMRAPSAWGSERNRGCSRIFPAMYNPDRCLTLISRSHKLNSLHVRQHPHQPPRWERQGNA